jgi:hypothetical protein
VKWGMSYQNLMMYLSTIPQYKKPEKEKEGKPGKTEGIQEVKTLDDFWNSNIQ